MVGTCRPADKEVNAMGQEWDRDNPNWIDPGSCPKGSKLIVDNTNSGCEIFFRGDDVVGNPDWVGATV